MPHFISMLICRGLCALTAGLASRSGERRIIA
jgi:hypothetical protein